MLDLKRTLIVGFIMLAGCDTNGICPAKPCNKERPCDKGLICLETHQICAIPCIRDADCPTDDFQHMNCYMSHCVDGDGLVYNYCLGELNEVSTGSN